MSPLLAIAAAGLATALAWPLTRWLGRGAGWPLAALYLLGAVALLPQISLLGSGSPARPVAAHHVVVERFTHAVQALEFVVGDP